MPPTSPARVGFDVMLDDSIDSTVSFQLVSICMPKKFSTSTAASSETAAVRSVLRAILPSSRASCLRRGVAGSVFSKSLSAMGQGSGVSFQPLAA